MTKETMKDGALAAEIFEWETELRRLLMGEKALEVFRLGGAVEYLNARLRRKEDRAASSAALREAIRRVVAEERPEDWELTSTAACFLDLVGAYRPAGGFLKVVALLQIGAWPFGASLKRDPTYPAASDLHLKALDILRIYFPVPPIDERLMPAYNTYVTLLRDHLPSGPHYTYALLRLIELGALAPESTDFRLTIHKSESSLEELLSYLILPGLVYISPELIGRMYVECLRIGQSLEGRFRSAVYEAGGSIEDTTDGCRVALPDGRVALVRIPWNDEPVVTEYMEQRHQRSASIAEQYDLIN